MAARVQVLKNIQEYARNIQSKDYQLESSISTSASHEARLERTIQELNSRVEVERKALDALKARIDHHETANQHYDDESSQIRQLEILTAAYHDLTPSEPILPSATSALPGLLALRKTKQLIYSSSISIRETHSSLQAARSRLSQEQSDLQDAHLLTQALEKRIVSLREATASKTHQSADDAARVLVEAEEARQKAYERDTKQTMRSLVAFIGERLSPLLAAEELGGPVAGSVLDISEDMLATGFNAQGKPKKSKATVSDDMRQMRIDQIWGQRNGGAGDAQFEDDEESSRNEAQAATDEMKALVEELLNTLAEGGSGSWVKLNRESAAARFLVRSGVAILHRTDALKIRLHDFGREVDD